MSPRFDLENYVDVQDRISRFWTEYPDGRIETELWSPPEEFERVVFKATVYKHREDTAPSSTGWAAETAGSGGANQTSWHENGETSSLGRALANMGYATSAKDRPSRQEMDKVARTNGSGASRPLPGTANVGTRTVDQRTGAIEDAAPVMAKEGQVQAIERIWKELAGPGELSARLMADYAQEDARALTQEQAGDMIGALDEGNQGESGGGKG